MSTDLDFLAKNTSNSLHLGGRFRLLLPGFLAFRSMGTVEFANIPYISIDAAMLLHQLLADVRDFI